MQGKPADPRIPEGLPAALESLYGGLTLRRYVSPDPLEILYGYTDPADQAVSGLIASCLARGRVRSIVSSARSLLTPMAKPSAFLADSTKRDLELLCSGFRHRFTDGGEMASFLWGIRGAIRIHGGLEALFRRGLQACRSATTVLPALEAFVGEMRRLAGSRCPTLLPSPEEGSACKRLHLWLRWMVRRDAVDPGPWKGIPPSLLVIPLDTHMFRICASLGFTSRRQAGGKTALEITEAFRAIRPDDPVRYDFCLTRMGIRDDCDGSVLRPFLKGGDP